MIGNAFQEKYNKNGPSLVAISGRTAFVGLPYASNEGDPDCCPGGSASVYYLNNYNFWVKVEDPFTLLDANEPPLEFGNYVFIDGDLACVGEMHSIHLFHREGDKWVQFDNIALHSPTCSIAGNTIAVYGNDENLGDDILRIYRYDQGSNGIVPLQDQSAFQD